MAIVHGYTVILYFVDISDVQNKADPLAKVKAGLQGSNKEPVPLKSVHIRGQMMDMVAQVSVQPKQFQSVPFKGVGNLEGKCISKGSPYLIMQYAANPIKID